MTKLYVEGDKYIIPPEDFANVQAPQKIGESLYRMPDGTLLSGVLK